MAITYTVRQATLFNSKSAEFANFLNLRYINNGGVVTEDVKADNKDRAEKVARTYMESVDSDGFLNCEELINPETKNSGIIVKGLRDLGGQSYFFQNEIPNFDALNLPAFYQRILQQRKCAAEGDNLDAIRDKYSDIATEEVKSLLNRKGGSAIIRAEAKPILTYKLRDGKCGFRINRGEDVYSPRKAARVRAFDGLIHDNIIYSAFSGKNPEGVDFSLMEYVENIINPDKVFQVLSQEDQIMAIIGTAVGLRIFYELGCAHRDIKPENILLVKKTGRATVKPKIADLGLVRLIERVDQKSGTVTGAGDPSCGTPDYGSPEHFREYLEGKDKSRPDSDYVVDIQSDICSLGLTAYYWITGTKPIAGEKTIDKMENAVHRTTKPKRIIEISRNVRYRGIPFYHLRERNLLNFRYRELEKVIAKMIHIDKERRHDEPSQVVDDLENILAGKRVNIGDISIHDIFR